MHLEQNYKCRQQSEAFFKIEHDSNSYFFSVQLTTTDNDGEIVRIQVDITDCSHAWSSECNLKFVWIRRKKNFLFFSRRLISILVSKTWVEQNTGHFTSKTDCHTHVKNAFLNTSDTKYTIEAKRDKHNLHVTLLLNSPDGLSVSYFHKN